MSDSKVVLGPNGRPAQKTFSKGGNPIGNFWSWSTSNMGEGMKKWDQTLWGGFGMWCVFLGVISIFGMTAYMFTGRTTTASLSPRAAGEALANDILKPLFRSAQGEQDYQPRNPSIYDQAEQQSAQN